MLTVPLMVAAPDGTADADPATLPFDPWYEFRWCATALAGVCVILGVLAVGAYIGLKN